MEFEVEVTPRAEADIAEAYAYIRRYAPAAADRWLLRLRKAIASLGSMPPRCPLAPEAERVGQKLYQLLVGRRSGIYRVIFRIRQSPGEKLVVQVLAVRHGAREAMAAQDFEAE